MSIEGVFSDINLYAALPLTVTGLAVAIWQARKARDAAEAAEAAAKETKGILANNYLLVLLPQLQRIEQDLEVAIGNDDHRLVVYHLGSWRWQAGQVRHLIEGDPRVKTRVVKAIQQSIALTAQTKLDLLEDQSDLPGKTRSARESITVVTGELGGLVALYSNQTLGGAQGA